MKKLLIIFVLLCAVAALAQDPCSDPSNVGCNHLDTAPFQTNFDQPTDGVDPTLSVYRGVLDTTTKYEGTGSLRFDLATQTSNQNPTGLYHYNIFPAPWTRGIGWGRADGNIVNFLFRFRVDAGWIARSTDAASGSNGMKIVMIDFANMVNDGQPCASGNDANCNVAWSCTDGEVVMALYYQTGVPILYHGCGSKDGSYEGLYPRDGGTTSLRQQGGGICNNLNQSGCVKINTADHWYTIQIRLEFTPSYTSDRNYKRIGSVTGWISIDDGVPQIVYDITGYDFVRSGTSNTSKHAFLQNGLDWYKVYSPNQEGACCKIWFTNFDTGLLPTYVGPAAAAWYDGAEAGLRRIPESPTYPNAATGVTVLTNGTDNTVSWDDNSDVIGSAVATGWEIQRAANRKFIALRDMIFSTLGAVPNLNVSCTGTPKRCTFVDSGAGGSVYTYRVRPLAGAQVGAWSQSMDNVPGGISDVTATTINASTIQVNWTQQSPNTATCYVVERCVGTGTIGSCGNSSTSETWTVLQSCLPANTTSYNDTTASPKTTYTYRVKSTNAAGAFKPLVGDLMMNNYAGGTLYAQATTPSAVFPYGWTSLGPQTAMSYNNYAVCPNYIGNNIHFSEGCSAAIRDWVGALFRTSTDELLIVDGGGHTGYAGNETYALKKADANAGFANTFTRKNEPKTPGVDPGSSAGGPVTLGVSGCDGGYEISNGTPSTPQYYGNQVVAVPPVISTSAIPGKNICGDCQSNAQGFGCEPSSKHSYYNQVYIPQNSISCSGFLTSTGDAVFLWGGYPAWISVGGSKDLWFGHFQGTNYINWQRLDGNSTGLASLHTGGINGFTDFDSGSQKIIIHDGYQFGTYDLCTNTYVKKADALVEKAAGIVDSADRIVPFLYLLSGSWHFKYWYIDTNTLSADFAPVSGCDFFTRAQTPGDFVITPTSHTQGMFGITLNTDTNPKKLVVWPNYGEAIYEFSLTNPPTCERKVYPGIVQDPSVHGPSTSNGAYRRFSYNTNWKGYDLIVDAPNEAQFLCPDAGGCSDANFTPLFQYNSTASCQVNFTGIASAVRTGASAHGKIKICRN